MEKREKEIKVREFRKKDAEACSKIISETIAYSGVLTKREQEHIKKRTTPKELIKKMKKREHFVCEKKEKIIGASILNKNEIRNMYVLPEFQKKGIGSLILKKIEKEAKKNKIKKLFLYTHPKASKFYLKNKFEVIKRFKDKNNLPVVYMEKELK